ncbi:MAG TPA: EAL domain-containing protein [Actinomycetota bacterium]
MNRIRVLICDDDDTVREALADLISSEPSLDLVAQAQDTDTAIALAFSHRPDVVLIDVKMPGAGGVHAARQIRAGLPFTRILALSAYEDRRTVLEMIRAGAVGYLVKGSAPGEILEAIHRSLHGMGTLAAEVTADVLSELAGHLETNHRSTEEERSRVERIEKIISNGGLKMVFQPVVELKTGRVLGLEALARFNVGEPRPPEAWFAEAASLGLGIELEVKAITLALERLPELPPDAYLAVNVSPETADSEPFREAIDGAPGERIVLEVTEHAQVEDYAVLVRALEHLRDRGFRLAVDDAGAGFASPRHILGLSPDIIKLDMSLTRGIHNDRARRALAAALISFASEFGSAMCAEGIETHEELTALQDLGVLCGQGFYLARPGPLPLSDAPAGT